MPDQNNTNENEKPTAVTRSRPAGFVDLREEIDRLWQTALANPWRPFRTVLPEPVFPAMDVFEKDGKLQVHAELPGLTDKDIEIAIDGDTMTISGEKTQKHEVDQKEYHRSERSYGRFLRQIALPAGADTDNVTAQFKDGVLEVSVPVTQPKPAKKVQVNAA
jgi:HSP20 family protein